MNIQNDIRSVLKNQATALLGLVDKISPEFEKAAKLMFHCKGKVIISGIGKSGLVAQKIASTFSSTGTPAIFLHPVEAIHGNLGVVQKSDVMLIIGKSGESEEILSLIPSLRKLRIKIICITANNKSSLARNSDLVLYTPIIRESCPLDLAPTTSTTVTMALGDALAVAIMKMRKFDKNHFALYHPGGLLGKRLLLKVKDVMRSGSRNPVVNINKNIKYLLEEISRKWTGAASIVDGNNRLVGLVTDYDLRKSILMKRDIFNLSIKNIMNPSPITIHENEMAVAASQIMEGRAKPLTVLPVVNDSKKAVGMIHLHDLITQGLVENPF